MAKWQYCDVWVYSDAGFSFWHADRGPERVKIKRDRSAGDQGDGDAAIRVMAELGENGWEMCGVVRSNAGVTTHYFKRPLSP